MPCQSPMLNHPTLHENVGEADDDAAGGAAQRPQQGDAALDAGLLQQGVDQVAAQQNPWVTSEGPHALKQPCLSREMCLQDGKIHPARCIPHSCTAQHLPLDRAAAARAKQSTPAQKDCFSTSSMPVKLAAANRLSV